MTPQRYVLALPKGRILKEFQGILTKTPLRIEDDFYDDACRKLMFATNRPDLSVIRVRSFDVATFVRYGAAHLGVAGMDAIAECQDPDVYVPLNLGIGACRLSVAAPEKWADSEKTDPFWHATHIRVATKYPNITQQYYAQKGIQAECVKLNGAMELAPALGLCRRIVDLVSSGETLRMNGLKELETILPVTAHLIVNRTAYKLYPDTMGEMIALFQEALS